MAQNKFQPCRLCGTATPAVVNINFKAVPICESCCGAIFIQQAQWYVKQDFSHLYKPQLTKVEQKIMDNLKNGVEICYTAKIKGKSTWSYIRITKGGPVFDAPDPKLTKKSIDSLITKGLIREYSKATNSNGTYTYYKKI